MWHALRAELAYAQSYLFGGLGIAVGVVALVSGVFYAVGEDGPPAHAAAAIRGLLLIIAPMVVCFVVQAYRSEEHRARLLLAGPLTRGVDAHARLADLDDVARQKLSTLLDLPAVDLGAVRAVEVLDEQGVIVPREHAVLA